MGEVSKTREVSRGEGWRDVSRPSPGATGPASKVLVEGVSSGGPLSGALDPPSDSFVPGPTPVEPLPDASRPESKGTGRRGVIF